MGLLLNQLSYDNVILDKSLELRSFS